ncbi:MAG: YbaB/EbfC family nucleoid-associated protein [Clostridia bacterium]
MKVRIPKDFGGPSQQDMLKKINTIQEDMAKLQVQLDETIYDISAGGGAIKIKINGKKEVQSIELSPEIVDKDDIEMLSDMLVAATNEAIATVENDSNEKMGKLTAGLPNIPGIM